MVGAAGWEKHRSLVHVRKDPGDEFGSQENAVLQELGQQGLHSWDQAIALASAKDAERSDEWHFQRCGSSGDSKVRIKPQAQNS